MPLWRVLGLNQSKQHDPASFVWRQMYDNEA